MPHVTDEAICIRHWDYSETSQTVSLFVRGHGLLRGLAKGAKRAGGRFSGGIDLMTRGQVVAIVKPGRELATLTDWGLIGTYRSLRTRLDANQTGYYMIDLVQQLVADSDPHPRLYDALVACLERIEAGDDCGPLVLLFQWLALDEAGYRPMLEMPEGESQTVHFSPTVGGVAASGWKVRRPTMVLLQGLAGAADGWEAGAPAATLLEGTHSLAQTFGAEVVGRANRLLATYVRHVLGSHPETMRALFPEI